MRDGLPLFREHSSTADARPGQTPARSRPSTAYTTRRDTIFSADDRHRAVHMSDRNRSGEVGVWVDGVRLMVDAWLDQSGYWVGDRFYVLQAAGPEDHPDQQIALGLLGYRILSLVIHDAWRRTTRVLVPDASETWTNPFVRLESDQLHLYADESAVTGDRPDRSVPAESPLP